ncbi:MAG: cyclic di-GMP phosphodiesterase [Solirubrobacteraceae bacterium]|nr:cyclic di-GMP phosphodiesterase [Solirubrobacteraceae bacterium]
MTDPTRAGDRILIVDDEPGNVLVLERLLEQAGYDDVRSTSDSTQVEALYGSFRPDVVLLDLHMPVMDGFAVMQRLSELIDPGDYVPILVLTADATHKSKRAALEGGAKDFVTKPFDHAEVLARMGNLLESRALHVQLRRHNDLLEETVRNRTAELEQAIGRLELAERDRRLAQEETIHRLALAAEFRDDETSRHIERMSRYCAILGERVGLSADETELLRMASKMHDIGKLGIPDAILRKPGPLTPEEFEVMKAHAEIGHQILHGSESQLASTAAMLAWTHHEKLDGSGYPRGLQGDEIPVEGRIAAIADVFDALTTDRVYRKAFPLREAVSIMRDGRGTHFDSALLDLFLNSLDAVLATRDDLVERAVAVPVHPAVAGVHDI